MSNFLLTNSRLYYVIGVFLLFVIIVYSKSKLPTSGRAATTTKAFKARALPKFWVIVNPISTRGADYAHHSTIGLVWLKFAVAALFWILIAKKYLATPQKL